MLISYKVDLKLIPMSCHGKYSKELLNNKSTTWFITKILSINLNKPKYYI